ncbi:hypothetical protein ASG36_14600 [Geodermatophilus sp. Leaf369]|uniref:hypothetical protein n=1 Tax=Geodermatophilus sp. Leaf369 TaxID=1736354 RepID=UPI000700FBE6|nr:hypothetical protein [Geodermatophilus sp. Leaf369]KQS57818.1 hypothetical protein ASG36_14600 [Geodermatophilus sp. Leaf369]
MTTTTKTPRTAWLPATVIRTLATLQAQLRILQMGHDRNTIDTRAAQQLATELRDAAQVLTHAADLLNLTIRDACEDKPARIVCEASEVDFSDLLAATRTEI